MMARRRRSDEDVALGCLVYMLLIIFLMPVAGICFLCIVRLRLKYPEGGCGQNLGPNKATGGSACTPMSSEWRQSNFI